MFGCIDGLIGNCSWCMGVGVMVRKGQLAGVALP